jgi:2'-5' RNA ligase
MPTRTFIAVAASSELRHGAMRLIEALRPSAGDVKWVAADHLHWTLHFLGNIDDRDLSEVCEAVAKAADEIEPFDVETRGAGAFPSADRPRTLWIGAGQGERNMSVLHAAIERRLKKRGYRGEERRFVPHITIGRARGKGRPHSLQRELATLADYDAGAMLVDEVTVYASELGRDGPEYRILSHAPLASS